MFCVYKLLNILTLLLFCYCYFLATKLALFVSLLFSLDINVYVIDQLLNCDTELIHSPPPISLHNRDANTMHLLLSYLPVHTVRKKTARAWWTPRWPSNTDMLNTLRYELLTARCTFDPPIRTRWTFDPPIQTPKPSRLLPLCKASNCCYLFQWNQNGKLNSSKLHIIWKFIQDAVHLLCLAECLSMLRAVLCLFSLLNTAFVDI